MRSLFQHGGRLLLSAGATASIGSDTWLHNMEGVFRPNDIDFEVRTLAGIVVSQQLEFGDSAWTLLLELTLSLSPAADASRLQPKPLRQAAT